MGTGKLLGKTYQNCEEVTCDELAARPGEVEILHATETGISSGSSEPVLAPMLHQSLHDHS